MRSGKPNPRSRARRLALQGLYEWQLSGNPPDEIETRYLIEKQGTRLDVAYFRELMKEIPKHVAELDAHIAPLLSRPFDEVDPVEKSVLRLGAYELAYHPDQWHHGSPCRLPARGGSARQPRLMSLSEFELIERFFRP